MEIKAQSIDFAAGGYLRHRFLRAFTGAVLVLALAGGVVGIVFAAMNLGAGYSGQGMGDVGMAAIIAAVSAAYIAALAIFARPRAPLFFKRMIAEYGARHFVSAIGRTLVVLGGAVALGAALWFGGKSLFDVLNFLGRTALFAFAFFAGLILAAIVVTILASLIQGLWRRITGLLLCALFLSVGGGSIAMIVANPSAGTLDEVLALDILVAAAALICFELAGQAWWQLWTPKDGFYAARGWRPSLLRLFSSFRHSLGLPGFISSFGKDRAILTLMYLGISLLNAGIVAIIAVPVGLFAIMRASQSEFDAFTLIIIGAVCGGLAFAAFVFGGRFTRMVEARTTKIYQSVRDWDTRAPILFLRSYDHEAARIKARSIDPMLLLPAGIGRSKTMDNILLENGAPYGPVIAIGDPRGGPPPLGAARIFVPGHSTEWQPVVQSLCGAAQAIVMCPSSTAGVRWELDLIQRHDIARQVIYIANPELSDEDNLALFQQIAPDVSLVLPKTLFGKPKTPIAAFLDPQKGWRVLATKKRSLQSYTIALNIGLQRVLGIKGSRPAKAPKPAKIKKAKKVKGQAPIAEPAAAPVAA